MIDLTGLSFAAVEPSLLEFGGIQRGTLGGPSQQLNRLGTRWAFALALPPMSAKNDWTARIVAAKQEGAIIRIPEPGYAGGTGGLPVVASTTAGGATVPITGMALDYAITRKWVSFVHGGVRFAHLIVAAAPGFSPGEATLTVTPMLRTPLSAGDLVEFGQPKAQGLLTDKLSWSVGTNRLIQFSLQLEERA